MVRLNTRSARLSIWKAKKNQKIFLPFRCLGLAEWQPNSVLGPLGTPLTVQIHLSILVCLYRSFVRFWGGEGSKIVIYESPVLAQKGGTQAYPPLSLLISQTAERKMLFQSEDFTCFMNMKMKVNEKSRADLLLYQILLIVSHGWFDIKVIDRHTPRIWYW